MSSRAHAFLPPSSARIWSSCPPSARLGQGIPDEGSEYAREGTDAHALCEHRLKLALGRDTADPRESLDFYSAEMEACAGEYADLVMDRLAEVTRKHGSAKVLIEQMVSISRWVPDSFGSADCIIIADGHMEVIDFKYGLGVLVEANGNYQMQCYALGALDLLESLYDVSTIAMTICQPRRENISSCTISREDLLLWADEFLAPRARLAYEGAGEFCTGEHCRFCKAKAICRARAERNLELAAYEFRPSESLDDLEMAAILGRLDELVAWADDVKGYALKQALSGKRYAGFKLVEGRSVRKYTDEEAVARAVVEAGYEPYERKLLGITAMTSSLGRRKFEEILGGLVAKAPGKPTLVEESDKRPALDAASDDFKQINVTEDKS